MTVISGDIRLADITFKKQKLQIFDEIFRKKSNNNSFLPFLSTVIAQLVAELRLVGPVRVAELNGQVHHLRFDLVVEGIVAKSFLSLRIHLIIRSDYYLTCTA